MSKIDKILEKWRRHPTEVEWNEVSAVLKRYRLERINQDGSHFVFHHPHLVNHPSFGPGGTLTVPTKKGRHVKGVYLDHIIEAIDVICGTE